MKTLVLAAATLVLAAPALGAHPLVPPFIQAVVKKRAANLAYTPTRAPFRYTYVSYRWHAQDTRLEIRLADKRYPNRPAHTIAFTAEPYAGSLTSCGDGKEKTIQYDGNRVYWDGHSAWRCVRATNGKLVKLAAEGPNLPDVALAQVVASGKRV